MSNVNNLQVQVLDSNVSFSSNETPLVYSNAITENSVSVNVIAPFGSNVNLNVNPNVLVNTDDGNNNVIITPSVKPNSRYSNIYTQIVKISFELDKLVVSNDKAVISVSLNEETAPDTNPDRLGEPIRKTIITADPA